MLIVAAGLQLAVALAVYRLAPASGRAASGERYPAVRSRLATASMVTCFSGGVAGSIGAGAAYRAGGWWLVCGLGVGATLLGAALWAGVFARRARTRPRCRSRRCDPSRRTQA